MEIGTKVTVCEKGLGVVKFTGTYQGINPSTEVGDLVEGFVYIERSEVLETYFEFDLTNAYARWVGNKVSFFLEDIKEIAE